MKHIVALTLALLAMPAMAQTAGPQGGEIGKFHEQVWRVPSDDAAILMETTLFRPDGAGPFPLVVINHGSPAKASERPEMRRQRFGAASQFFVERGFAVAVPLRRGYGTTGGPWVEEYGRCNAPNFYPGGIAAANDIESSIRFMQQQSFIDRSRVLVVGQSAGGWASIALAAKNPADVLAIINFAGGRGGYSQGEPNTNCDPGQLSAAAKRYGSTAKVPMLWVYTMNDGFFRPEISKAMAEAFTGAGGRAEYRLLPAFGKEGHNLFGASEGPALWGPEVDRFLANIPGLKRQ